MSMTIIPAIDLLDGSCVRLLHGDFAQCKVYDLDAQRLAADYAAQGAEWLHVVDLAASRDGPKANLRPLLRLLDLDDLERAAERIIGRGDRLGLRIGRGRHLPERIEPVGPTAEIDVGGGRAQTPKIVGPRLQRRARGVRDTHGIAKGVEVERLVVAVVIG